MRSVETRKSCYSITSTSLRVFNADTNTVLFEGCKEKTSHVCTHACVYTPEHVDVCICSCTGVHTRVLHACVSKSAQLKVAYTRIHLYIRFLAALFFSQTRAVHRVHITRRHIGYTQSLEVFLKYTPSLCTRSHTPGRNSDLWIPDISPLPPRLPTAHLNFPWRQNTSPLVWGFLRGKSTPGQPASAPRQDARAPRGRWDLPCSCISRLHQPPQTTSSPSLPPANRQASELAFRIRSGQ